MTVEFITKQDLEQVKSEITETITTLINVNKSKQWLRSKEVREMLGISPGTLQNMRIHGHIPFSKIGGTLFYDSDKINSLLNEKSQ